MRMHEIEIDDEVFSFLKAKAEPLVDTPNSVLRRELLEGRPGRKVQQAGIQARSADSDFPDLPPHMPQALRQILEVTWLVGSGQSRSRATATVAKRHGVAPQTVLDKYCRQLGLTAGEFDRLLAEPEMVGLRRMLRSKFSQWSSLIEKTLHPR